jgi:hypothetical protein
MKKYILLGSPGPSPSKNNLRMITTSDSVEILKEVWETINGFYSEIGDTYNGKLSRKALDMIEENGYLSDLYDVFYDSAIMTVDVVGIFETVEINSLIQRSWAGF